MNSRSNVIVYVREYCENSLMNKLALLIKVGRIGGWRVAPLVFLFGLIVSGNISGSITITPY